MGGSFLEMKMIIDGSGLVALCKHQDNFEEVLKELVANYNKEYRAADGIEVGVDVNDVSFPALVILGSYTNDYGMDGVFIYNTVTFVSVEKIIGLLE